jgi:WD40 repeat protein
VSAASFSPDGQRIVTASEDRTARVWDAATGKELARLQGHEGNVSAAWFSPDGQRIVTASLDKTARVWDAATGKELARLQGHEDHVSAASFSPDGKHVVTASSDKTARVWDIQITSMPRNVLTQLACREVVPGDLSKLRPEELTPAIDPTHDFDIEGDVCTPVSAWRRLLNSISGLGHARDEGAAAAR